MTDIILKYKNIENSTIDKATLSSLFQRNTDIINIDNFINLNTADKLLSTLRISDKNEDNGYFRLPDGCFFPFPYSIIRGDQENATEALNNYLSSNKAFSKRFFTSEHAAANVIRKQIEQSGGTKLLCLPNQICLSPLSFRVLFSGKNGIDIHCENAFLNQLDSEFKKNIYEVIDLENALSLFITLQAPEEGGELVLFNKTWENTQINVNETSYEERHNIDGSIFKNRGHTNIEHYMIKPKKCSATIFRAAQIWHSINYIGGNLDRVTIGCFIAEGKDGNIYYWA
ncbi:MAG: hypothetical protein WD607_05715 [Candidatus Paceibacterota bacterium]